MAFNHEIVPDYLRTKPEMDVERKVKGFRDRAATVSADATTKQINQFNKICSALYTQINNKRDEWRNEDSKTLSFSCLIMFCLWYDNAFVPAPVHLP